MSYRVKEQRDGSLSVYDGPHFIGTVVPDDETHTHATKPSTFDGPISHTFPTVDHAVEWLVAEFRDIPWADRPAEQRV